jgi:WD40 repeat protein
MCAVGGWDHRTSLIYHNGKILALLRGNSATVTSVDWLPDTTSGLLATGPGNGSIYLWQAYPS